MTSAPLHADAARRSMRLLRAFVLDKALYELGYELNNRPDWVRIPLVGIRSGCCVTGVTACRAGA